MATHILQLVLDKIIIHYCNSQIRYMHTNHVHKLEKYAGYIPRLLHDNYDGNQSE